MGDSDEERPNGHYYALFHTKQQLSETTTGTVKFKEATKM